MTKKIFYSLYGLIICLFIIGCVRDERDAVSSANIPNDVTTKAYVKLSPWNENEAFIKNVRSSFIKNIDLEKFKNEYGSVFWDYTISFPNVQEAGLAIPVVKNNDVVAVLKATFKDNRINLKWVNDEDPKEFFRSLIFKDKSRQSYAQGIGKSIRNGLSASIDQVAVMEYKCTYKTISIGCPNDQTDCPPMSRTVSECSWIETGGQDFESIAPPSDGGGGGGGDGTPILIPDVIEIIKPKYYIKDLKKYLSCLNLSQPASLTVYAEKMGDGRGVGHAFISITQGDTRMTFGFYPDNPDSWTQKSLHYYGVMGDNSDSGYTHSKDYGQISPGQLKNIVDLALKFDSITYNILASNCSTFASDVMTIAGETNIAYIPATPNTVISRFGKEAKSQSGKGPSTKSACSQ
ncbi:hypothetical protein [Elizabethkingia anophelis]|uniref:hypothetical protein n=1 Tax=Elizabethkingia anophelis TaxID=1117645 RepID=UPI0013720539|nr:hypothetical protein [Elizabethkingia anophelis]MCT4124522.1 hypothetical protein [Elizabethkingia anophelis]MDV3876305.1 hypothetical protein [Elizabethkingia anophelis]MYY44185.1 hypothetical protein [Elizabethkingia anophelis]